MGVKKITYGLKNANDDDHIGEEEATEEERNIKKQSISMSNKQKWNMWGQC